MMRKGWGIVLCVIALSFVTALNWTPINYTTIFGLQGRYWLPVLPLVLALVHHNRTFAVQKPAERKAVFAMLCLRLSIQKHCTKTTVA